MATWSKLFSNFAWKNRPDTSTPLGQNLLNRLNNAINGIDDRVVTLNAEKVSVDEMQAFFTDVRLIKNTGQFVFTLYDGTEKIIDTALEKISINVSFDQASQMMVLEKEDGSKEYVDLSAFTTQYEFASSPTIQQTVTDGKVTANIKPNSITDQMLQTNYLSDITTQANTAVSASQSALESQSLAEQHAEDAEASADRAEEAANRAESVAGFTIDTELSTTSTNPIANKAVAEEFEKCFKNSGGTVNGNITASRSDDSFRAVIVKNSTRNIEHAVYAGGTYRLFDATNNKNIIASNADGTNTFNGTASGNLPLTGGGTVKGASGSPVRIQRTGTDTNVSLQFLGESGVLGHLGFLSADVPMFLPASGSGSQKILHTGNKPTGTYTGNGDATQRYISLGGIGDSVLIQGNGYETIITKSAGSGGNKTAYKGFGDGEVYCANGNLELNTAHEALNASGVTYTYRVL